MRMDITDISVIINCHTERILVYRSLKSVVRARQYAEKKGVSVETLVVLDRPDTETAEEVKRYAQDPRLFIDRAYTVDLGDIAQSRNYGVNVAHGKYIAFLDGDDLFCENWLYAAYLMASKNNNYILHPELNVAFGTKFFWWRHIDQESSDFVLATLFTGNYWSALAFASKDIFLQTRYETHHIADGFGYEDWHWNCATLSKSYLHKIVPTTIHFVRYKASGSRNSSANLNHAIIRPSGFFKYISEMYAKESQTHKAADHLDVRSISKENLIRRGKELLRNHVSSGAIDYSRNLILLWKQTFCMTFYQPIRKIVEGHRNLEQKRMARNVLPKWVLSEMKAVATIEARLYPSVRALTTIGYYEVPRPDFPLVNSFAEAYSQIGESHYSYIFVLPWLKAGGADLGAIRHIRSIHELTRTRVLVITTEVDESPWRERIRDVADLLQLGKIVAGNGGSFETLVNVLTRLLIESKPKVIHNINSNACWMAYKEYGPALKHSSKLFASAFADGKDTDGRPIGYIREYLEDTYSCVQEIFSDNSFFPALWAETYGVPISMFHILYFPVPDELIEIGKRRLSENAVRSISDLPKILWTGRIAKEKRPDILAAIAKRMPNVQFDVWGYAENRSYVNMLAGMNNVHLKGRYDNFASLPHSEYCAYLYTSESDGMPNTLLEAAAVGLKIVGPVVGGSRDLLDDNTAYIVQHFEDIDSYCEEIGEALMDISKEKETKAHKLIETRHSYSAWTRSIKNIEGYIDACEGEDNN